MKRKLFSWLTVLCMVLTMVPTAAFATDSDMAVGTSGIVCAHHTEHNEDCGFVAPQNATERTEEITCNMECTDTDGDGKINHDEGCAYTPATEASLGTEGTPCGFVCAECADENALAKNTPTDNAPVENSSMALTYD